MKTRLSLALAMTFVVGIAFAHSQDELEINYGNYY